MPTLALKRPARAVIAPLPRADGSPARGSLADAGLAAAPRVPLWTPGRRTLSASGRPPRSACSPRLPLPGNKCAGASAREPGDGAGARRPGIGAGAWPAGHFMAAPRSAQDLCVNSLGFFNGFPLHGRLQTIHYRGGLRYRRIALNSRRRYFKSIRGGRNIFFGSSRFKYLFRVLETL
jgi:hypothetical protein